jgi:adenylate kinase family enzyme
LNKEISKKSEFGKHIVESRKNYSYVSDEIVIDLVKLQIELLEKDQKSWIIEGFPRTRQQALAL